jgi:outer membrane protein OmpA-like peptidoglycan-associated protein
VVFSLITASTPHAEPVPSQVSDFLASRDVVGVVYFGLGSALLTQSAKSAIDNMVPQLRQVDLYTTLVRLEGFASPDGDMETNVEISMMRAKAVADYLQERYQLGLDYYLVGFGAGSMTGGKQPVKKLRRVEFALYENPWETETLPLKMDQVN